MFFFLNFFFMFFTSELNSFVWIFTTAPGNLTILLFFYTPGPQAAISYPSFNTKKPSSAINYYDYSTSNKHVPRNNVFAIRKPYEYNNAIIINMSWNVIYTSRIRLVRVYVVVIIWSYYAHFIIMFEQKLKNLFIFARKLNQLY